MDHQERFYKLDGEERSYAECQAAIAACMASTELDKLTIDRGDGFLLTILAVTPDVSLYMQTPDGAFWALRTDRGSIASHDEGNPIIQAYLDGKQGLLDDWTWEKVGLDDEEARRSTKRLLAYILLLVLAMLILRWYYP